LAFPVSPGSAAPGFLRNTPLGRGAKGNPRPACLGQADGDGLFGGAGAVFTLANVVHLFADEFTGLGAGGFALPTISAGPFESFCFRHKSF